MFFLKAFSRETDLKVTPGDFAIKKRKIGKGNLYLTKNQNSRNEICCVEDYFNYISNMCKKEFSGSNFNNEVVGKISIFE